VRVGLSNEKLLNAVPINCESEILTECDMPTPGCNWHRTAVVVDHIVVKHFVQPISAVAVKSKFAKLCPISVRLEDAEVGMFGMRNRVSDGESYVKMASAVPTATPAPPRAKAPLGIPDPDATWHITVVGDTHDAVVHKVRPRIMVLDSSVGLKLIP